MRALYGLGCRYPGDVLVAAGLSAVVAVAAALAVACLPFASWDYYVFSSVESVRQTGRTSSRSQGIDKSAASRLCVFECDESDAQGGERPYRRADICMVEADRSSARRPCLLDSWP